MLFQRRIVEFYIPLHEQRVVNYSVRDGLVRNFTFFTALSSVSSTSRVLQRHQGGSSLPILFASVLAWDEAFDMDQAVGEREMSDSSESLSDVDRGLDFDVAQCMPGWIAERRFSPPVGGC